MIAKAAASNADLVFLDLEDAVAPAAKAAARPNIVEGLRTLDWGTKVKAFRINGVHTPWCHDDLVEVISGAGEQVDVVIVPKVKSAREVWFVDDLLTQLELGLGLEPGRIGLEVLIEEVDALARVEEIAGCSPRLEALILGVGDLAASQGMPIGHIGGADGTAYPGDIWHYARCRLIGAARMHGLDAIDGPFADFADGPGYHREASWARALGAVGKWCIHPSQIEVANRDFSPTPDEVADARAVVDAFTEAENRGLGAVTHDGVMVDVASVRLFETVLERARRCGVE